MSSETMKWVTTIRCASCVGSATGHLHSLGPCPTRPAAEGSSQPGRRAPVEPAFWSSGWKWALLNEGTRHVHARRPAMPAGHLNVLPPAIWGRLAPMDASDERHRSAARPLALQRSRLFDRHAEAYDRFRPTYPEAVIDE